MFMPVSSDILRGCLNPWR